MITTKHCIIVLHIELGLFVPQSVTLTIFQGHSGVNIFTDFLVYLIKLKLCKIVIFVE